MGLCWIRDSCSIIYLAGEFDDVHAFVSNLYWKLPIEDNVFAILRNRDTGVVARCIHNDPVASPLLVKNIFRAGIYGFERT